MRPLIRSLAVVAVAFALSGGVSLAHAVASDRVASSACAKTTSGCHEAAAFTCACCDEGGEETPAPALPSSDRTSASKPSPHTAVLLPISAMHGLPVRARELSTSSTRRAGPPIPLSILHASLLL